MTSPNRHELLEVAVRAAQAAGEVLLEDFAALGEVAVRTKSTATDLVSDADVAAENAVRAVLRGERPDDAIVGEEGHDTLGTTGVRWLVDPLDGTVNFLLGIPHWSVSIAAEDRAGVVLDPIRGELFTARAGEPPELNGATVTARHGTDLTTALVATGFAYDAAVRERQAEVFARVLPRVGHVRRMGSAALDLAWTAAGRFDAYYECGSQAWDVAAGTLLCAGAGLAVRPLRERDGLPPGVVVAPPGVVAELEALIVG